jgi:radical SAM protein with 4Fe4S-binding SPASM domain
MQALTRLRNRFKPTTRDLPEPGLYHYLKTGNGSKVRLHLRVEADGKGLMVANASRIYHFNSTAATMAYLTLEEVSTDTAVAVMQRFYDVPRRQAQQDYADFCEQFALIASPDEVCPACELDLETTTPFSDRPSAPYRMDLALTYRCSNDCHHCYNARSREHPELDTAEWKTILDRLWEIGIPHVVFTGGEPTLRSDLPELIAHAEQNGQITGINTNGRRLKDPAYVQKLVDAGLDHVQITLESHIAAMHDQMVAAKGAWEDTTTGIRNALQTSLFVMTNTTLLESNSPMLGDMLNYLADLGVPTIGLNALIYSGHGLNVDSGLPEAQLPPLLEIARQHTADTGQRLIWYTPTQYCHFDPVEMSLGVKGCTAALYNMCIEPDGNVIPCQSYYKPLGNLLAQSWDSIWNHDLAVSLRERKDIPTACRGCSLLQECGGGCPLAREALPDIHPVPITPAPFWGTEVE